MLENKVIQKTYRSFLSIYIYFYIFPFIHPLVSFTGRGHSAHRAGLHNALEH